jgi:hypothetical protein
MIAEAERRFPVRIRVTQPAVRVPVDRDHRFRWKVITQSGRT